MMYVMFTIHYRVTSAYKTVNMVKLCAPQRSENNIVCAYILFRRHQSEVKSIAGHTP
jgi:hypothetical protein